MKVDIATSHFIATAEIQDSNLYNVDCPKGHRSYVLLQQQKFELLFDIGACALLDGYYREAVSSFTSSLERFYEFFVRAALLQRKLATTEIDLAWKKVSRHSERQLGAYVILYLYECGSSPLILGAKETEFRNGVIHRGKIPTRDEAIAFGQHILEIVRPALQIAKQKFPDGVKNLISSHLFGAHHKMEPGLASATSCMPTIISLSSGEASHDKKSLKEALAGLKMWNWFERT
jgi:hypothetical protein